MFSSQRNYFSNSISFDNIKVKNHFLGPLSVDDLEHFIKYGYVIKHGLIENELLHAHQVEVRQYLKKNAMIDFGNTSIGSAEEAALLSKQQSKMAMVSNGFGGMVNFYHGRHMYKIREHPKLYESISQLYSITYSDCDNIIYNDTNEWPNQYHSFNPQHMYMFINRCGFRIPNSNHNCKQQKDIDIDDDNNILHQKGTGLHLDCNPFHLFRGEKKLEDGTNEYIPLRFWQPIQAFVNLTDTPDENQGGFWTVPQFHRDCVSYFSGKKPEYYRNLTKLHLKRGNAFDINPTDDNEYHDLIQNLKYIPLKRGDTLFWDWRMPHTNDRFHNGPAIREVVYASHLPKVIENEKYNFKQKEWYLTGVHPSYVSKQFAKLETMDYSPPHLTELALFFYLDFFEKILQSKYQDSRLKYEVRCSMVDEEILSVHFKEDERVADKGYFGEDDYIVRPNKKLPGQIKLPPEDELYNSWESPGYHFECLTSPWRSSIRQNILICLVF
eukprot:gene9035-11067_t